MLSVVGVWSMTSVAAAQSAGEFTEYTLGSSDDHGLTLASHYCVLSGVQGVGSTFATADVSRPHESGSQWDLLGSGRTICVPWSNFLVSENNPATIGETSEVNVTNGDNPTGHPELCAARVNGLEYEGACDQLGAPWEFSYITSVYGYFAGGAEGIHVKQAFDSFKSSGAVSSQQRSLSARFAMLGLLGLSMFDRNGQRGEFSDAPEPGFTWYADNGQTVAMIPTSEGLCAFTHLQGRITGAHDSIEITAEMRDGVNWWVMRVATDDWFHARARCVAYDQQ